ncbi:MAG: peptidase [Methylotenera sp.]|uniref:PepSY domain-containing protein n=1 Tax=Methylotenera sp. TaxID=2051956 RepID=UPI0017D28A28|nr:PepSY domain-containing protein [Methylotenera sp.]NOU23982.1 peptidase [Methylotenera sp.]
MKKNLLLISAVAAALTLTAGVASADFKIPKTKVSFEKALKAALAKHSGDVETVELELNNGKPQYEFDIKTADGVEHEVEVSAITGKIIEEEIEVASASDTTFASKAKVSEADAEKTALAAFPGTVHEKEYSIESDGNPSYEFDIKTADGKEIEVEVDAVTGKVLEHEVEVYQIGKE